MGNAWETGSEQKKNETWERMLSPFGILEMAESFMPHDAHGGGHDAHDAHGGGHDAHDAHGGGHDATAATPEPGQAASDASVPEPTQSPAPPLTDAGDLESIKEAQMSQAGEVAAAKAAAPKVPVSMQDTVYDMVLAQERNAEALRAATAPKPPAGAAPGHPAEAPAAPAEPAVHGAAGESSQPLELASGEPPALGEGLVDAVRSGEGGLLGAVADGAKGAVKTLLPVAGAVGSGLDLVHGIEELADGNSQQGLLDTGSGAVGLASLAAPSLGPAGLLLSMMASGNRATQKLGVWGQKTDPETGEQVNQSGFDWAAGNAATAGTEVSDFFGGGVVGDVAGGLASGGVGVVDGLEAGVVDIGAGAISMADGIGTKAQREGWFGTHQDADGTMHNRTGLEMTVDNIDATDAWVHDALGDNAGADIVGGMADAVVGIGSGLYAVGSDIVSGVESVVGDIGDFLSDLF